MINKKDELKTIPNVFVNRSLKEMSNHHMPRLEADSILIEYKLNSQGYRCNEFNNQKILTLGCSQTEGHGLPLELTWPYLISEKINKDYINLAKGGEGMQAQIIKAFQFFKEFYHPEYIFAVFPITRLEVPLINFTVKNEFNYEGEESRERIGKAMLSNKLIEKFSKEPHVAENVLPEEFGIFYNILFLKIFIQYCKSNNIKLLWTYYNDSNLKPYSFKDFTDTYFEIPYLNTEIPKNLGCHLKFSDNIFFDKAADYDYWPPGHWGFHKQMHIADSIYDRLDL
jgi:hypothetical protein